MKTELITVDWKHRMAPPKQTTLLLLNAVLSTKVQSVTVNPLPLMAPPPSPPAEFPMNVQRVIVHPPMVLFISLIAPPMLCALLPMKVQSMMVGSRPLIAAPPPAKFSMNVQLLTV
jgi:hypothetical protein